MAVDDLSFELGVGQIVALLGENGSGKSTIIGVLAGLFGQDFDGRAHDRRRAVPAARRRPCRAQRHRRDRPGDQRRPRAHGRPNPLPQQRADALGPRRPSGDAPTGRRRSWTEFDVPTSTPAQPIGSLDLASQQLVMIARALHKNARLLILDEPTAALTGDETDRLFERLRSYRARGTTSLFVSHRLAEVFAIADRILVLRDGALVGDHDTAATTRDASSTRCSGRAPRSSRIAGHRPRRARRAGPYRDCGSSTSPPCHRWSPGAAWSTTSASTSEAARSLVCSDCSAREPA